MSDYWKRMEYLRNRIQDQQILRDAQVQNSTDYQFFQNEITHLTNELLRWEENVERLDLLDRNITTVDSNARVAKQDKLHAADNWLRLAVVCGVIGAMLLALNFRWSLSSLLFVTGAMLLLLAAIAVFMSTRTRTAAWDEMARTNHQLHQMREERDRLIPVRYPSINPFPRFSHEVIVREK